MISTYTEQEVEFCAIETNYLKKLLFAAQFSENPSIYVYNYDFEIQKIIRNVCTLEISDIRYDMYNNYLYVFCGCPEYEMKIIDLNTDQILEYNTNPIRISNEFVGLNFKPDNGNTFVCLQKHSIDVFSIKKIGLKNTEEDNIRLKVDYHMKNIPINSLETIVSEDDEFTSFLWFDEETLCLSTKLGHVLFVNVADFHIKQSFKLAGAASQLLLNNKYLIVIENHRYIQKSIKIV